MTAAESRARILVTGGTGFIGRHCLTPLVGHGAEVHAISTRAQDAPGEVTWHRADLLAPGAAEELVDRVRPTHLLHLAWETAHGRFWTSPENLRWLCASLELFRAFADGGGRRAVAAGTCVEYRPEDSPCVEGETPLEPFTLYGTSKHAFHEVASAYAELTSVELAWGRIFFLYGPEEDSRRLVASLAEPLLRGAPAPCTHGRQVRDFLHVEDVAGAFAALLLSDVTGSVNIASGTPTTIAEVATRVAELAGRPDLLRIGALPAAAGEPAFLVADVDRLTREVGWRPRYDLESGLRATVEWWRGQAVA